MFCAEALQICLLGDRGAVSRAQGWGREGVLVLTIIKGLSSSGQIPTPLPASKTKVWAESPLTLPDATWGCSLPQVARRGDIF